MSEVGETERETQNRVVKLFQNELGYTYLGNWQYRENNRNIEPNLLKNYLAGKSYSPTQINKAIYELTTTANNCNDSLQHTTNKNVYHLLRYGVKVKAAAGENFETVHLINWNNFTVIKGIQLGNSLLPN